MTERRCNTYHGLLFQKWIDWIYRLPVNYFKGTEFPEKEILQLL